MNKKRKVSFSADVLEKEKEKKKKQMEYESRFEIAIKFHEGKNLKKDWTKALELYKEGIELGHLKSIYNSALICELGDEEQSFKKYWKIAISHYEKLVKMKHLKSFLRLAAMYEEGNEECKVDRDIKKSIELYLGAVDICEKNKKRDKIYTMALKKLGLIYQRGEPNFGIKKDPLFALFYFQKGEDDPEIAYQIGLIYLDGCEDMAIKKNKKLAFEYFDKAADLNFIPAIHKCVEILKTEKPEFISSDKAEFFFGCDVEIWRACEIIPLYEKGIGLKDPESMVGLYIYYNEFFLLINEIFDTEIIGDAICSAETKKKLKSLEDPYLMEAVSLNCDRAYDELTERLLFLLDHRFHKRDRRAIDDDLYLISFDKKDKLIHKWKELISYGTKKKHRSAIFYNAESHNKNSHICKTVFPENRFLGVISSLLCNIGQPDDDTEIKLAIQLYKKSSDLGHVKAKVRLGQLYLNKHLELKIDDPEKKETLKNGIELIEQAEKLNDLDARFSLAMYCDKLTVDGTKRMIDLLKKNVELNHLESMLFLADIYKNWKTHKFDVLYEEENRKHPHGVDAIDIYKKVNFTENSCEMIVELMQKIIDIYLLEEMKEYYVSCESQIKAFLNECKNRLKNPCRHNNDYIHMGHLNDLEKFIEEQLFIFDDSRFSSNAKEKLEDESYNENSYINSLPQELLEQIYKLKL